MDLIVQAMFWIRLLLHYRPITVLCHCIYGAAILIEVEWLLHSWHFPIRTKILLFSKFHFSLSTLAHRSYTVIRSCAVSINRCLCWKRVGSTTSTCSRIRFVSHISPTRWIGSGRPDTIHSCATPKWLIYSSQKLIMIAHTFTWHTCGTTQLKWY